jgi:hypothetical protein
MGTSVLEDPVICFFRTEEGKYSVECRQRMCRIFNVLLNDTRFVCGGGEEMGTEHVWTSVRELWTYVA